MRTPVFYNNTSSACKITVSTIIFLILLLKVNAQSASKSNVRLNFSLNSTYEYTDGGDTKGYAMTVGVDNFLSRVIAIKTEFRHAAARDKPNFAKSYREKNVNYIDVKVAIHPFNNLTSQKAKQILGGLHLAVGPSVLFGTISKEGSWISYLDSNGIEVDRVSRVIFESISDAGFVVKVGYEKYLFKSVYFGARLDWSSYINNDGYTSYGVLIGVQL